MSKGLSLILWMSPFLHLGIFFPLGIWFAFFKNRLLRTQSFTLILIQSIVFGLFFILELSYYLKLDVEDSFMEMNRSNPDLWIGIVWTAGLVWLIANAVFLRREAKKRKIRSHSKRLRMSRFWWNFLAWILAVTFSTVNAIGETTLLGTPKNAMAPLGLEKALALDFFVSLALFYSWFSKGETFALLRPFYKKMVMSSYRRNYFLSLLSHGKRPSGELLHKVHRSAFFRDNFLPGWGHVYAGDFWKGFPLLFVFLIGIFLFATAFFSWDGPLLGIQFLGTWGLKPGIPDREFFQKASNIQYMIFTVLLSLSVYVFSKYLLHKLFLGIRLNDNQEKTGIRAGFLNNLPISLLVHLILLMIVLIIPFSLQRKQKPKNEEKQASHFQPENMEFYFIDPNIPDDVKDLNGGIITGTDTPNKEQGEKISDEEAADNGPKKGFIKKIKGKKVPPTYSNYISAKMRGPENYLDYWRRAPQPYSSVVAYTITSEGFVEDVELVEGSNYPDQDLLTLELIESLSPLMEPPTKGKSIRVTELFWNGSLDPDAMPTPLQKEMVTHFDGRYMEELNY